MRLIFGRNVSLDQFRELVDEELSPFLKRYNFTPHFKDIGRGYGAYFLRDDLAFVLTWEFQSPQLECDLVRLPKGPEPAMDRLVRMSGPDSQNWFGLETLISPQHKEGLPPHIGNFPTAEDYRRGLHRWREALEADGMRLMAGLRNG